MTSREISIQGVIQKITSREVSKQGVPQNMTSIVEKYLYRVSHRYMTSREVSTQGVPRYMISRERHGIVLKSTAALIKKT